MPIISRFFGIVIMMYYNDHNPPHFHAKYAENEILLTMDGIILEGNLPPRALGLVQEWLHRHRAELKQNWQNARDKLPLKEIPPLE